MTLNELLMWAGIALGATAIVGIASFLLLWAACRMAAISRCRGQ